jgi:hypothetical protein
MENKGVELVLNLVPVKIKSFEWDLTLNFTKNVNKVLQLAPGVDNITLGGFTGTDIRAVKGYSYATIFGQDFLRDKKGNIIIDDVPAYISGPDTTINTNYGYPVFDPNNKPIPLGSTLPDWTLGITNSFTVYDLSFSFLLDIKHGGKMWNGTVGVMNYFGTGIDTKDRDLNHVFSGTPGHIVLDNAGNSTYDADGNDIVATSGTKNMLPVKRDENWYTGNGTSFGGGPTSQEVEDASWVRLKEISVSYKLPNTLVEKTKFIKSFSVYFSGKNLWLSTKYSGVDPETSLYGASSSQGIDYFNMPGTKTYTFGIKAMF